MLRIYHNPRCKISRQVLTEIKKVKQDVEIIEYLKNVPSIKELEIILMKLNLAPIDIIRKEDKIYKEQFKEKKFTDHEWIKIIHDNPILIQRPIVVDNNKAFLCRPAEKIVEILHRDK